MRTPLFWLRCIGGVGGKEEEGGKGGRRRGKEKKKGGLCAIIRAPLVVSADVTKQARRLTGVER